ACPRQSLAPMAQLLSEADAGTALERCLRLHVPRPEAQRAICPAPIRTHSIGAFAGRARRHHAPRGAGYDPCLAACIGEVVAIALGVVPGASSLKDSRCRLSASLISALML